MSARIGDLKNTLFEQLLAAGLLHPPVEDGDPLEDFPDFRLPKGTAEALIDSDRGERWSSPRVRDNALAMGFRVE